MVEQDNPVFYKLVNSVTGHYYLGATATPEGREQQHLKHIRAGRKPKLWQQMWNDHPQTRNVAVWRFHIVRHYQDMEDAIRCEHAFLQARVKKDPMCLNQRMTADKVTSPLGRTHSPETCARISESLSAALSGDNHPRGFKGKKLSPEHLRAMREGRERARARRMADGDPT